jgi:sugar phosphate isomerase/epimerase
MISRRDLGKLALASLSLPAMAARKIDSVVAGIQFGLQSYIFTRANLPVDGLLDVVIASMKESGLGECDLYAPVLGQGASIDEFRIAHRKFDAAGIEVYGISGFPVATEADLSRPFEIAELMDAKLVTLTVTLPVAKAIVPLVEKSRFLVGIQGNPSMNPTDPETIARPEQYEAALSLSKRYWMSFDIGDAVGGGYDVLQFVEAHHDRIALLYLKDRRKDRTSVSWGQGDTPIAEILRLIRDNQYPIRCYIDSDYPTVDRPADVKRSFEYAKKALG